MCPLSPEAVLHLNLHKGVCGIPTDPGKGAATDDHPDMHLSLWETDGEGPSQGPRPRVVVDAVTVKISPPELAADMPESTMLCPLGGQVYWLSLLFLARITTLTRFFQERGKERLRPK